MNKTVWKYDTGAFSREDQVPDRAIRCASIMKGNKYLL